MFTASERLKGISRRDLLRLTKHFGVTSTLIAAGGLTGTGMYACCAGAVVFAGFGNAEALDLVLRMDGTSDPDCRDSAGNGGGNGESRRSFDAHGFPPCLRSFLSVLPIFARTSRIYALLSEADNNPRGVVISPRHGCELDRLVTWDMWDTS